MFVDIPPVPVLLVILGVTALCIGWIPWLIAAHRGCRHTFWIALSGFITAPIPLIYLGILFWALLGPTTEAQGNGFPVDEESFQ